MRLLWLLICGPMLVMALGLAMPSVGALGLSKPANLENLHVALGENYQFTVRVYGESQPIEVELVADNLDFLTFEPQRFTLAADESREVLCTLRPENLGVYKGSLEARAVSTAPGNPVVGSVGANLRVTVEEISHPPPEGVNMIVLLGAIVLTGAILALFLVGWRR